MSKVLVGDFIRWINEFSEKDDTAKIKLYSSNSEDCIGVFESDSPVLTLFFGVPITSFKAIWEDSYMLRLNLKSEQITWNYISGIYGKD